MSDGVVKDLWVDFVYPFRDSEFPEFQSKPKIFISNACLKFKAGRRAETKVDGPTRDIMVWYSCMPGYTSLRNPSEDGQGSWFIYFLIETIMQHYDKYHLAQIMRRVHEKQDKRSREEYPNGVQKYQCGHFLTGLFKKFYF